jgi:signal transduction histidine kinase
MLSSEKQYCHIVVQDNGIGFDAEYSEKIFEVFQRLTDGRSMRAQALGLSIVKKIVDNHHGFIKATSEKDKGARFDIYIPQT